MSTLRTEKEKTIKVILKKFNIQFNSKHLQANLVELYIDLASQQCPEIASSWKSKSMPVSMRFNIRKLKSILDFYEVPYPNPPQRPDVVNLYEALKSEENLELNPLSDRKTQSTSAGKLKSSYLLARNHSKKEDEEDHNNSLRKEKMKPTLVIARTITPKPRTLSKRKKVQVNTDKKPAKKPRLGGSLGLEGTVLIESLRNPTSDPTNLPLQSGSQSNATLLALDPSKAKQQNSLSHHWPSESGKAIVTPSKVTMSLNPVDLQQAKGQSLVQEKIITGALDSSIDSSKKQKSSGIEKLKRQKTVCFSPGEEEPDCCSLARLTNSAKISDKKHDYEENVANTIITGITLPPVAPHILLEGLSVYNPQSTNASNKLAAATAQIFNQDQSVSKSQYMDGSIHFAKSGSAKESESTAGPSATAPNISEAHNKPTAATQTIIEDLLGLSPQSMNGGNPMFAAVPNVRSENFETLGSNLTIGNDISPPKHQTPKDAQIFEGATSFRQIHDLSIDRGNSQLISLNRQKSSKCARSDSLVWPAFRANREDQLLISAAIMSTKQKGKKCAAPFFSSRLKSQDDINFSTRGAGTSEQAIDQLHYRDLMKNQDFQNATKHQYSLDDWAGNLFNKQDKDGHGKDCRISKACILDQSNSSSNSKPSNLPENTPQDKLEFFVRGASTPDPTSEHTLRCETETISQEPSDGNLRALADINKRAKFPSSSLDSWPGIPTANIQIKAYLDQQSYTYEENERLSHLISLYHIMVENLNKKKAESNSDLIISSKKKMSTLEEHSPQTSPLFCNPGSNNSPSHPSKRDTHHMAAACLRMLFTISQNKTTSYNSENLPPPATILEKSSWHQTKDFGTEEDSDGAMDEDSDILMNETYDSVPNFKHDPTGVSKFRPDLCQGFTSPDNLFLWNLAFKSFIILVCCGEYRDISLDMFDEKEIWEALKNHVKNCLKRRFREGMMDANHDDDETDDEAMEVENIMKLIDELRDPKNSGFPTESCSPPSRQIQAGLLISRAQQAIHSLADEESQAYIETLKDDNSDRSSPARKIHEIVDSNESLEIEELNQNSKSAIRTCGENLFHRVRNNNRSPLKYFVVQTLPEWLGRLFSREETEKSLDKTAFDSRTPFNPLAQVSDIHKSKTLKSFKGPNDQQFTAGLGNITFAMFIDAINPYGNCQTNSILRPVVQQLQSLWESGLYLSQTYNYPSDTWPTQNLADHNTWATASRNATTIKERNDILCKQGFHVVDAMHNHLLGLLKWHCERFWQMSDTDDEPPPQSISAQEIQDLIANATSQNVAEQHAVPSSNGRSVFEEGFVNIDLLATDHSSDETFDLFSSEGGWGETWTAPSKGKIILNSHMLSYINKHLPRIKVPSWVKQPLPSLGKASHGQLKADEWRNLFTIQLPLILPVYWLEKDSEKCSLFRNFAHLVSLVKCALKQSTSIDIIKEYRHHIHSYLSSSLQLFPHSNLAPNHHMTIHLADCIKDFGPVRAWWSFSMERLMGEAIKASNNNQLGMFD
ncbi:hypothetical protein BY996DRAFT_8441656 [Phakopsora pachyrhizi]|nr:hypothetical protein BY996DRAFT_8441656 [Phakopsora pachyrhizi]